MKSRECEVCGRIFRVHNYQHKTKGYEDVYKFNCTPCYRWARDLGVIYFSSLGAHL
jgi:lipoate-protein ligase A